MIVIIYLVRKDYYDIIGVKYLVSGHSFSACVREFGAIEKRRQCKAFVPDELKEVVRTTRVNNPFIVEEMIEDIFDLACVAQHFIDT